MQTETLLELSRLVAVEGASPADKPAAAAATMPQLAVLLAQAAERCPLVSAPSAEAAPSPELALQRERALAARASCANPRCANLEAPAKGKRCGGCGVARYCGEACSVAAWRAHKPACRQWRQQREQGAA